MVSNFSRVLEVKSNTNYLKPSIKPDELDIKTIFPQYIYNPPYGFPKRLNGIFLRRISQNLHISSILKNIKDGIVNTKWEIVPEHGVELTPEEEKNRQEAEELINNPNEIDTYDDFMRKWLEDLLVLEAGVYQHIFNKKGELKQLRAVDGNAILKNPDIHGSFTSRDSVILDYEDFINSVAKQPRQENIWKNVQNIYNTSFTSRGAYFQYNSAMAYSFPIPYGKDEIVYIQMNPESYGVYTNGSPVSDAVDVILSLIYGVKYHLDFYLNGNTPEGIINIAGGSQRDIDNIKQQLTGSISEVDENTGFQRKMGYVLPITTADGLEFKPLTFNAKDMEILAQQELLGKLLWQRFGVTADEMGWTANSNRATSETQTGNSQRKAIEPYLLHIEKVINKFTIKRFFKHGKKFRFQFVKDKSQEELTKLNIYEKRVNLGIETWQTIAEKENIDMKKLKQYKQENEQTHDNDQDEDYDFDLKSQTRPFKNELLDIIIKSLDLNKDKILEDLKNKSLEQIANSLNVLLTEPKRELNKLIIDIFNENYEKINNITNLEIKPDPKVVNFIEEYTFDYIKGINEDLVKDIRGAIKRGILDKKGINDIQNNILEVFDIKKSRAETIARTEMKRANSQAELQAWLNSGVGAKKWVSITDDDRTTNISRAMHKKYGSPEQAIPITEEFEVTVDGKKYGGMTTPFFYNDRDVIMYIYE